MFYMMVQNCSASLVLYYASDKDADSVMCIPEFALEKM